MQQVATEAISRSCVATWHPHGEQLCRCRLDCNVASDQSKQSASAGQVRDVLVPMDCHSLIVIGYLTTIVKISIIIAARALPSSWES
eukprot:3476733-Amphidinium_carterae.2